MKPAEKTFLFILILALLLLLGCFGYKLIVNNYEYDSFTDVETDITTIARGEQQEEFYVTGADLQGQKENQFEGETDLFQIDFEKLQEINPDVKGWLIIPAADVDHVSFRGQTMSIMFTEIYTKSINIAVRYSLITGGARKNRRIFWCMVII